MPSEFREVFKSRSRSSDENFTILYRHNKLDVARIGMAVSAKNINLATARNRIKRLIRESFRHKKEGLKGLDIVVTVKKNIHISNNRTVSQSLANHWEKLKQCENS